MFSNPPAFHTARPSFAWNRFVGIVLLGGVAALALLYSGRFPSSVPKRGMHEVAGVVFSTLYDIKVIVGPIDDAQKANLRKLVEEALEFVDVRMSCHKEGSELDRLNRAPKGTWVPVSPETARVLTLSRKTSEWSRGAFDVTVGPLVRLWGFHDKMALSVEPPQAEVDRLRSAIGYKKIELNPEGKAVRKWAEEIQVDLSAIAKGFAVDLVSRRLAEAGYGEHMVEVGGEIQARGRNLRKEPWRIAVQNPAKDGPMKEDYVLSLENIAVATSGDYQNYYELDGKRLSHTINPRTGRPIDHALASITVVHESCADADAMATALNVLGPEDGYDLALRSNLAALFLIHDAQGGFSARATPMLERYRTASLTSTKKP
ncbi:MAG: FAD:protein FMN transferase [Myxococcota bacterium]|nr:FAD:protein FMN transferase [Myxococcota bacterium]